LNQKKYEAEVTKFINSILFDDVTKDKGVDYYVNKVSGNVIEYFDTYKISTDDCPSDDNKKILTTFKVINDFVSILEKTDENENPDINKIIKIINDFNIKIKDSLNNLYNTGMISYFTNCKNKNNYDEKKRRRENPIVQKTKRPLFAKK
jgi:hypothetical protein